MKHSPLFFQLYFIDHAVTVVPILPLVPLHFNTPHSLMQPQMIVHVHGSCIKVLRLLHFLYCTLHPHGYSVMTYLYFLIPSALHPFSPILLAHLATIKMLSVSMILSLFFVCLACFLDSIFD